MSSFLGLDHEFALIDVYSDEFHRREERPVLLASAWTQVWYWRIARWRWPCAR